MTAGFTAGTGKAYAGHAITSWNLYEVSPGRREESNHGATSWLGGIFGGKAKGDS